MCLAGTPYAGGFFRVKLVLGKDFPQTPPKAYFLTKIFHPNVAANGEICVNTLKKDWKPGEHSRQLFLLCEYYSLNSLSWWNSSTGTFLIEDTIQKCLSIVKFLIPNLFHLFPARFGYQAYSLGELIFKHPNANYLIHNSLLLNVYINFTDGEMFANRSKC